MKKRLPHFAQYTAFSGLSALGLMALTEAPAQAHTFYAELERTDTSAKLNSSFDLSNDVNAALTLGVELVPNLGLELTLMGDNVYPDGGTDQYGAWKTRMVTSGSMLGIRGIFPINDAVTLIARTGIQYLDVSIDYKESSDNWNSFTHYQLDDSTERWYLGGGAQVFIGQRTYLTAEYIHYNETDPLFTDFYPDFSLSSNYVGIGLGVVF